MALDDLEIGDILERAVPIHKEYIRTLEVYCFYPGNFQDVKGIIFPNDEIIHLNVPYDVIVKRIIKKMTIEGEGRLVFTEPYHEFEVGEVVDVRISGKTPTETGKFSLYGYKGFVNDENVRIGDELTVKIRAIKPSHKPGCSCQILETVLE